MWVINSWQAYIIIISGFVRTAVILEDIEDFQKGKSDLCNNQLLTHSFKMIIYKLLNLLLYLMATFIMYSIEVVNIVFILRIVFYKMCPVIKFM